MFLAERCHVIGIAIRLSSVMLVRPTQTAELFHNRHCSLATWLGCEENGTKIFPTIFTRYRQVGLVGFNVPLDIL